MTRVKVGRMKKQEIRNSVSDFLSFVFELDQKEDVIDFFVGLLSVSESVMLGRRIRVAKMLIEGESYNSIVKKLGVGRSLISKTEMWLNSRDQKYRKVLNKYFKRIESDKRGIVNMEKHPIYKMVLTSIGLR